MKAFDCDKVKRFFETEIEPDQFAKMMRRYNHEVVMFHLEMETKGQHDRFDLYIMRDGLYWLNELAELLDPHLQDDR